MDRNVLGCATEFTPGGEVSTNQLVAFRRTRDRQGLVDQDGLLRSWLTPQGAAAEARYQGWASCSFDPVY
jgi:hypothetical protein